jgi:hypothetical protein
MTTATSPAAVEVVLIPDGVDLAPLSTATILHYRDGIESDAVPVARGLRAVPPRQVLIAARATFLCPADDPLAPVRIVGWAARASVLPTTANADDRLTRALAVACDAPIVGCVSAPGWLGDDAIGRQERQRLAAITGAAVENPTCYALMRACSDAHIPCGVVVAATASQASAAVRRFVAVEAMEATEGQ